MVTSQLQKRHYYLQNVRILSKSAEIVPFISVIAVRLNTTHDDCRPLTHMSAACHSTVTDLSPSYPGPSTASRSSPGHGQRRRQMTALQKELSFAVEMSHVWLISGVQPSAWALPNKRRCEWVRTARHLVQGHKKQLRHRRSGNSSGFPQNRLCLLLPAHGAMVPVSSVVPWSPMVSTLMVHGPVVSWSAIPADGGPEAVDHLGP